MAVTSSKGLKHVEPLTYGLDQSRLGRLEVVLSWPCGRRPGGAPGLQIARVCTWVRHGLGCLALGRAAAGRGLTVHEVSRVREVVRMNVRDYGCGVRACS